MFYGEPVLAACANNGTNYLDCTGEAPWIYDMVAKYDTVAKQNNSIIIPGCGLDSVVADIMAYVLALEVRKRYNDACERVIMTLWDVKTGISGGTSLTMLELFHNYSLTHLVKSLHPYSLSPAKPIVPISKPTGSLIYRIFGILSIPELGGIQTTWPMASVDECVTHRSSGLYFEIAQASGDLSPIYGPRFRFNEYMRARSLLHGLLIKLGLAMAILLLALPPTRWILSPIIKKFLIQAPGQGPSRKSMKNDFLSYKGIGIARDGKGLVTARLNTANGGYAITALTLSAAAQVVLRCKLEDTQAGRLSGGIMTPATLGDPYVKTLKDFGFRIMVDQ